MMKAISRLKKCFLNRKLSIFLGSFVAVLCVCIFANVTLQPSRGSILSVQSPIPYGQWWFKASQSSDQPTESAVQPSSSRATVPRVESHTLSTAPRVQPSQFRSLTPVESLQSQSSLVPSTSAPPKNVWTPVQSIWRLLDKNATLSLPLPRFGNYQCRDQICSEFLTDKDKNGLKLNCREIQNRTIVPRCHFMNGTHRSPVALVSFPGSGNTWVRGLLEKATGICTGE